jgi:hypothetical protein
MARTSTAIKVTVTDEQYLELLATRLAAMKGFKAGTVTAEEKNIARAAVRMARKVRKTESLQLQALRDQAAAAEIARAEKAEARKAARSAAKALAA